MSFWKLRNEVKLRLKSFEDEIDYFICLCAPLNFLSSSDTAQVGGWRLEVGARSSSSKEFNHILLKDVVLKHIFLMTVSSVPADLCVLTF